MTSAGIAAAAACFGAAAFAAISFGGLRTAGSARILPLVATGLAIATGGLIASRGTSLEHLIASGVAVAAFAAPLGGNRTPEIRDVLALGVILLVFSAALAGEWSAIGVGVALALPFAAPAVVCAQRGVAMANALLAALVGVAFGPATAFLTLLLGLTLAAIVSAAARVRLRASAYLPAIAFCALVTVVARAALA